MDMTVLEVDRMSPSYNDSITAVSEMKRSSTQSDLNDVIVQIGKLSREASSQDGNAAAELTIKHKISQLTAMIPTVGNNDAGVERVMNDAEQILNRSYENIRANVADAFDAAAITSNYEVLGLLM